MHIYRAVLQLVVTAFIPPCSDQSQELPQSSPVKSNQPPVRLRSASSVLNQLKASSTPFVSVARAMGMMTKFLFMVLVLLVAVVFADAAASPSSELPNTGIHPQPSNKPVDVEPEYSGWWRTPPSSSSPPPPPSRPSPPPPIDPWWCNRTYGEESASGDADDYDDNPDCPPPPRNCPWPCICPDSTVRTTTPAAAATTTTATTGGGCASSLAAVVMTCGPFLTGGGGDAAAPALASPCCTAFRTVMSAAAGEDGDGDGDGLLARCVCPFFLGDTQKLLPKPAVAERMLYLPIACSVALPPEFLYTCYTGQVSSAPALGKKKKGGD